ncbi:NADPH-dependent ferric siderophore reductase [Pseudonocardia sp. MH-G8]|nr:NADPH-dependent ferric siderophore reductase [Pseudonocardia sp. MH-G8]
MLSPSFVRLTVTGSQLALFAAHGRDQRIKILVPHDGYPVELGPGPEPLPEAEWRTLWRALAAGRRPVLRSYTVSAARPERQEVDLDVFLHTRPGPASAWATSARVGDRVLLSGPDARRGRPTHGIQWRPGTATSVLLAGDETAIPAMRGILASLGPGIRGQLIAEVADRADAAGLTTAHAHVTGAVCVRGVSTLQSAAEAWSQVHGEQAARHGEAFYAWVATESTRAARIREALTDAGIAPDRIHTQGYWNDRNRARAPRPVAACA